jgi:hypothetical protein
MMGRATKMATTGAWDELGERLRRVNPDKFEELRAALVGLVEAEETLSQAGARLGYRIASRKRSRSLAS